MLGDPVITTQIQPATFLIIWPVKAGTDVFEKIVTWPQNSSNANILALTQKESVYGWGVTGQPGL